MSPEERASVLRWLTDHGFRIVRVCGSEVTLDLGD